MNIKEQIKSLCYEFADANQAIIANYNLGDKKREKMLQESKDKNVDQILDLVLNSLTIENKDHLWYDGGDWGADVSSGYNQAIDAYEELKNKLRK